MSRKKLAFKILFLVSLWLPLSIDSFSDEITNQDEILVNTLRKGQFDQVINLINRGGNPNAKDKYGWSLLHIAAACVFRHIVTTHSAANCPSIPLDSDHPFRNILTTHSAG
jgi:ankyrin repeat protein